MVIAVNTRFLAMENPDGFGRFTKEVLERMVKANPDHQFHFFFERPFPPQAIFSSNITGHVLSPPARHPLLWKYWFDVKVAAMLRKLKADVFFSPDGQCSLTTKVPQCVVVPQLGFLHHPGSYRKTHQRYYQFYTPKFIRKATTVLTVSNFSKKDIIDRYQTPENKIVVVYKGVKPIFQPLDFNAQNAVKDQYTGGTEFFLYVGAIHPRKNLVNLLKAFSIFKRRLHSSFKLVLAGRMAWKNDEFSELLKTYKYKDDVIVTGLLEEVELAKLMASAYAFVYPSPFEGFGVPVIEAMKCGVPVLTSKNSAMEEITEGAALYFDPENPAEMGEKLMRVYKDEDGRKELIQKGTSIAQQYTWERAADAVWQSIMKTATNFKH
ncbi:MAG TPA: glycosyltransferase family 1 protein [Flavisolibacter sp.]|nr:glycosyltransferase family 1 protein [Flavisolibacter sp.]